MLDTGFSMTEDKGQDLRADFYLWLAKTVFF
jgi:hypothetical protein